jgi:hypothetical protein
MDVRFDVAYAMVVRNWALARTGRPQCSERIDVGRQRLSGVSLSDAVVGRWKGAAPYGENSLRTERASIKDIIVYHS